MRQAFHKNITFKTIATIMADDNLLVRMRLMEHLTPSEAKIADYFIKMHPQVAFETATSIGKNTNVSKATVVRFISRLGYNSFVEFQEKLKDELVSRLESPIQRYPSTKKMLSDSGQDILTQNIAHIIENLRKTEESIKREQFTYVAGILADSENRIFINGERTSYGPAHTMWILLNYLRGDTYFLDTKSSILTEQLMDVKPKDVLVAVSHRRYAKQTLKIAEHFSELDARIILIVDEETNPFTQLADLQLVIPSFGLSMFDTDCARMAVIESLILAVAQLREDNIFKRFELKEALFRRFGVFALSQISPNHLKVK